MMAITVSYSPPRYCSGSTARAIKLTFFEASFTRAPVRGESAPIHPLYITVDPNYQANTLL